MFLIEQTELPTSALPIAEFRSHLRLGTGFSDDTLQNEVLESSLRSAIAQIENLCSKAILRRRFLWTLHAWGDLGRQVLPRAPIIELVELAIHEPDATKAVVAASRFHLEQDMHRPALVSRGFMLPQIPIGGHAEISFVAGYADTWRAIPSDLSIAAITLATAYYEDRTAIGTIPRGVASLLGPYRRMRLLGGF